MDVSPEAEGLSAALRREIEALRADVADLRRRLGLDSSNSSKPPSSDGLKKKPRHAGSLRTGSGKTSGRQSGHKGGTLRQVPDPDRVVRHEAHLCVHCDCALDPASATGIEPGLHPLSHRRQTRHDPRGARRGVVVHDHSTSYYRMDKVEHAFCNAHILREPQSLIAFDKETWAVLMRDMLLKADGAVSMARAKGARALAPEEHEAFVKPYRAAVRLGLAFHRQLPPFEGPSKRRKRRPGHNLLDRLKTFHAETPRFLTDFDVPFTNNLAEQDLGMMKVKMKISGSFRTIEGARIFAKLGSIVSTARKQGATILQILAASPYEVMQTITSERRLGSYGTTQSILNMNPNNYLFNYSLLGKRAMIPTVDLQAAFETVTGHWSPKVVGRVNDQYVKVVKLLGTFVWHRHEDELFQVVRGRLRIEFEGGAEAVVGPGPFCVVLRGVMHNPVADEECWIVLIEPVTTRHTGDVVTPLTRSLAG